MKPLSIANVVAILNASLGEPAAMRLAETCGGKRIDIPKAVGGVVLAALGEDITTVLVDHYAGCALDVPSWGHIERMNRPARLRHDVVHSSLTANELACKHGVSSMWVRKLRKTLMSEVPANSDPSNRPTGQLARTKVTFHDGSGRRPQYPRRARRHEH